MSGGVESRRGLITAGLMVATFIGALDMTVVNVSLHHMQGSLSASADQITWVLTSYIVAAAIMTPLTGWFAGRFGRKTVFVVSITGFTLASALCGVPFMTGLWFHVAGLDLSTVMSFDLGVYLVVLGAFASILLALEEREDG